MDRPVFTTLDEKVSDTIVRQGVSPFRIEAGRQAGRQAGRHARARAHALYLYLTLSRFFALQAA